MIHFLLTRFNVTMSGGPPSPEWLEHRMKIFEEVTAPSVDAQTAPGFMWLVFCDPPIGPRYLSGASKLARCSATAKYGLESVQRYVKINIAEHAGPRDWVITTRLDSDDALEPHFIETIQKNFREETEFLNLPQGFQLVDGVRRKVKLFSNPFLSYVEKAENPKTVYHVHHDRAMDSAPVRDLISEPAWTQTCHEFSSNKPIGD